ncbi:msr1055 [Mesorhizobium japonicum MAFF 303099]|uniref:Msr1055 protein n=1 Tax=Mesorhizobium japonicum (strain LMG 29417 / CECT 9101 / MAFF 303099) TaxID=266835 RepID=Q98LE7_RHILO|nr:msr1055 [Mesorhizobium japonicum MAFF 303099]
MAVLFGLFLILALSFLGAAMRLSRILLIDR